MSADRLREAARVLRERAESAYREPWTPDGTGYIRIGEDDDGPSIYVHGGVYANQRRAAAYIATMHPGVGLALADWLDTAGADLWAHGPLCSCGSGCLACDDSLWQPHVRRALALADLILGGAV